MLIKILIALAVIVAVFLIVVAMQPNTFRIARSTAIAAPPSAIFAEVNDYRRWLAWSPFEKSDPAMQRVYKGAPAGDGAIYEWSGNSQAGEGRATITESRPAELIRIKLEFMRPFAGTNDVEFSFHPEQGQTVVTWRMTGRYNFMSKAFGLIINCEKMVSSQFDKGLAALKSIAEGPVNS
jgi:hypothetical protein